MHGMMWPECQYFHPQKKTELIDSKKKKNVVPKK